jgi:hypothetical protein
MYHKGYGWVQIRCDFVDNNYSSDLVSKLKKSVIFGAALGGVSQRYFHQKD